ncbi:MAG: hypothetical protein L6R42_004791 [Xanthoria sp. 1 TBL-2021]|nr:MAG: hypothetical protein L6R42_004791 [Xanthoria sp. 1 TBL-2021]
MPIGRLQARSFAAVLVLLTLSLLLLSNHFVRHCFYDRNRTDVKHVVSRQSPPEILSAINLTSENTRTVARAFGEQSHTFELFSSHHRAHVKRALDEKWSCLIEKGRSYYVDGVLAAYDGRPPGGPPEDFGEGEDVLKEFGWSRHEDSEPISSGWNAALQAMDLGAPEEDDVSYILLDQNLEFDNGHGEQVSHSQHFTESDNDCQQQITNARYYAYYSLTGFILVTDSYSPSGQLRRLEVPINEIPNKIPLLHRFSDALWFEWSVHTDQPASFRYYAVESIINHPTAELMDDIMIARRGSDEVSWAERLTFDLTSDEGKALFGCPNGVAVSWLLMHRFSTLGRREPRVTIFNPGGGLRSMIWDLIPEGKSGSFGDVTPDGPDSSEEDSDGG